MTCQKACLPNVLSLQHQPCGFLWSVLQKPKHFFPTNHWSRFHLLVVITRRVEICDSFLKYPIFFYCIMDRLHQYLIGCCCAGLWRSEQMGQKTCGGFFWLTCIPCMLYLRHNIEYLQFIFQFTFKLYILRFKTLKSLN